MHARLYKRVRSYHCILVIIRVDEGIVEVLDSLRKDPAEYKSLVQMVNR